MEPQNQYRNAIPSYVGNFPQFPSILKTHELTRGFLDLDNPILKPRNFYETRLEESLEKIVFADEPQQERGLVDKIFADRSKTLKVTVNGEDWEDWGRSLRGHPAALWKIVGSFYPLYIVYYGKGRRGP